VETTQVCVALVHQSSLLAQAVQSLLEAEHVPVVGMDISEDHVAERLRALQPSVVVIDADDVAFRACSLIALLETIPEAKLVCLRDGGDHLDVYRKTRISVRGARDLAGAIGAA
jgi:DNA-binding NarL/FixJ family response regulator